MSRYNLVNTVNKAKVNILCIYDNTHLDQYCLKEKRLLKIVINSQDNETKKA